MSKKSEEFFRVMQKLLPSTTDKYIESIEKYGEVLETVVIEDIFIPEIIKLLSENKDITLLRNIFDYFEEIISSNEEHITNIISITALEIFSCDSAILAVAHNYMGPKTIQLQIEADKDLHRV